MTINNRLLRNKLMITLLMFFFIITSGSVVGFLNARIFDPLYLLVSMFYYLFYTNRKFDINSSFYTALSFMLLYLFSMLIYDTSNYMACFSYLIRIVATFLLCNSLKNDVFEHYFHRIIYIISFVSLIIYIYGQIYSPEGIITMNDRFPMFYMYNFTGYIIHRNSSIFWEPGAYQLFLNLALIYKLKEDEFQFNKFWCLENIVLVLSIFSTASTSGYLTFLFIIICYILNQWYELNVSTKVLLLIPLCVILLVCLYFILSSETVVDKFSADNVSYNIRRNDLFNSIEALLITPIYGFGVETREFFEMEMTYGLYHNSVGFFCAVFNLGILYAIFYVYRIFRYCKCNNVYFYYPVLFTLFVSVMTEDFFRFSIYFAFAIGFLKTTKNSIVT